MQKLDVLSFSKKIVYYKQYLDKNISALKQWMIKIKIKTNEVKTYETEWDADLLLDQI